MLENYTNEHFADMQNDTDFLIALHQEVADLIAKNLGETMGQFAQKNYLSLLLCFQFTYAVVGFHHLLRLYEYGLTCCTLVVHNAS